MILKAVIVNNFCGYNGEHRVDVSDGITALVGKNDASKSTLLEALDIFYGQIKPERTDLSFYAMEAVLDGTRADQKDQILSDLIEYCKLDTLAMLKSTVSSRKCNNKE